MHLEEASTSNIIRISQMREMKQRLSDLLKLYSWLEAEVGFEPQECGSEPACLNTTLYHKSASMSHGPRPPPISVN